MKAGVNVYGGFKAYGNPGKREGERDISNLKSEYQTILDGDSKSQVVNGSGITTSTLWEGLTIQNGYVDGGKGGGIYMDGSGITLKNCLVKNNYLIAYDAWNDKIANDYSQGGAGVYMSGNCTLKDCIVRNNIIKSGKKSGEFGYAKSVGSGVYMKGGTVINSMIVENSSDWTTPGYQILGLALYVASSSTANKLYNSTIAYNIGKADNAISAAIFDANGYGTTGQIKLYNCILWGNTGYGLTGENYNIVCRSSWANNVGRDNILFIVIIQAQQSVLSMKVLRSLTQETADTQYWMPTIRIRFL